VIITWQHKVEHRRKIDYNTARVALSLSEDLPLPPLLSTRMPEKSLVYQIILQAANSFIEWRPNLVYFPIAQFTGTVFKNLKADEKPKYSQSFLNRP